MFDGPQDPRRERCRNASQIVVFAKIKLLAHFTAKNAWKSSKNAIQFGQQSALERRKQADVVREDTSPFDFLGCRKPTRLSIRWLGVWAPSSSRDAVGQLQSTPRLTTVAEQRWLPTQFQLFVARWNIGTLRGRECLEIGVRCGTIWTVVGIRDTHIHRRKPREFKGFRWLWISRPDTTHNPLVGGSNPSGPSFPSPDSA